MFKKILLLLLLTAAPALAQIGPIQGHSFLGGTQAKTQGLTSSNYLNGIIPHATISVYYTGTTTLVPGNQIFSNSTGTVLGNPFTSNNVTSVNPGGYLFFISLSVPVDVIGSGGISPNTYPVPVPLCVDCFASQAGGGGGSGCTTDCVITDPSTSNRPPDGDQTIVQPSGSMFTLQDTSQNGQTFTPTGASGCGIDSLIGCPEFYTQLSQDGSYGAGHYNCNFDFQFFGQDIQCFDTEDNYQITYRFEGDTFSFDGGMFDGHSGGSFNFDPQDGLNIIDMPGFTVNTLSGFPLNLSAQLTGVGVFPYLMYSQTRIVAPGAELDWGEFTVSVNNVSGGTVTLPPLTTAPEGLSNYIFYFNQTTSSATTLTASSGDTINYGSTFSLSTQGQAVELIGDSFAGNWAVVGAGTGSGSGGSVGTAGQLQMVGSTAGSFAASAATDNGTIFTIGEPTQFTDTACPTCAGAIALQQGTATAAPANNVQFLAPSSVTAYSIELPGVQPSGSSTFLSCTAANPAICSWAAGSGSSFITSLTTTGSSGAATVTSGVLNIPVYAGGGSTAWSSLTNPTTNLALGLGTNTTTFTGGLAMLTGAYEQQNTWTVGSVNVPAIYQGFRTVYGFGTIQASIADEYSLAVPSGATTNEADDLAAYATCTSTTTDCVPLSTTGVREVANAPVWGANFNVWDNNFAGANLYGIEVDAVAQNSGTSGEMIRLDPWIGSLSNPFYGMHLFHTGTGNVGLTTLIQSDNLTTVNFASLGESSSTGRSQNILFTDGTTASAMWQSGGTLNYNKGVAFGSSGQFTVSSIGNTTLSGCASGTYLKADGTGCATPATGITTLTGDGAAGPGSGSQALTLATVNSSPGSCGDSTHVCQITTNGKGLTTAQTAVAISGAGSVFGGGSSGWSGTPLTFISNATQYAPFVGGALTNATESVVQNAAGANATISGLQVTLSAALGAGATLSVTLRDGGVSEALTCTTTSGGSTCEDLTHSFNVTQGDELDFLLASSGTVTAGIPQIVISYTVGTANFAAVTGIRQGNGSSADTAATAHQIQAPSVCSDTSGSGTAQSCTTSPSFTPAANDCVRYTTTTANSGTGLTLNIDSLGAKSAAVAGSGGWTTTLTAGQVPSGTPLLACYTGTNWNVALTGVSASGGGTTVTAAPPYEEIGSTFYIPSDQMSTATKPPVCGSTTWLNSVTPTSCTNGTNGNQVLKNTSAITAWASQTGTTSVEGVLNLGSSQILNANVFDQSGVWIYDSTNGKIYTFGAYANSGSATSSTVDSVFQIYTCTSPCTSTNPAFSSTVANYALGSYGAGAPAHFMLSVSGTTLSVEYSLDGGQDFTTLITETVGTITKGGYMITAAGTTSNIMSIKVQ